MVKKNLPANAGDAINGGLIPVSGRSHGVGNGNPHSIAAEITPWTEEPGGLQPWNHTELDTRVHPHHNIDNTQREIISFSIVSH